MNRWFMVAHIIDFLTLGDNFSTAEMREVWSEKNRLKKQVDVEIALALAEGELGIIPIDAANEIKEKANAEDIDLLSLAEDVKKLKHSFMATINTLQKQSGKSGEYIHYGATTQDIVDTATVLQLKESYRIIWRDVQQVANALKVLSENHKNTIMVGRTHGMQALPITFGFKAAIWLDEFKRHLERLDELRQRVFVGNINGAVGTHASIGILGRKVEEKALGFLGLNMPNIGWQSSRDRFSEYASTLALISGSLGKIANEFYNLMRTELNEVEEPFVAGKIGSSTMPHKRNPAILEGIASLTEPVYKSTSLIYESMKVEHERDAMSWRAEWIALPEVNLYLSAQLQSMIYVLKNIKVNTAQMRKNLEIQQGLLLSEKVMFELGKKLGKQSAHAVVYDCSMRAFELNKSFKVVLLENPIIIDANISEDDIHHWLETDQYLGCAIESINVVISSIEHSQLLEKENI